jgi:hypothetical protein
MPFTKCIPPLDECIKPEDFKLQVGNRVCHVNDQQSGYEGEITQIDFDCYLFETYGVTTCLVLWDGCTEGEGDIMWTNKLVKLD